MDTSNSTEDFSGLLNKRQIEVLSILYIVLLSFSITGSFSVLLVSTVRWRNLIGQVHLLVQLGLADLLAAVILLCTSAMNQINPSKIIFCQDLLPLSLTFYLISSLLAIVYAWNSKNTLQGWRERAADDDEDEHNQCRRNITGIPLYAFVWVTPLAGYFVYVCTRLILPARLISIDAMSQNGLSNNSSSYCSSCILFASIWNGKDPCTKTDDPHYTFIRVFLLITVITVMLSCSVIYWKVGKLHERYRLNELFPVEGDGHSRRQYNGTFSTARNIVMVIIFCWGPALLLLLVSLFFRTKVKQSSLYGLYVMQAGTVSLQGFLNSMVYAWRRPNFTMAALGENTSLLRYNRRAFFEESLRR